MTTFANGESGSSVRTKINAAITTVDGLGSGDNLLMTAAERSKLTGVEANATADQTGAEIKTAYEAEADTNAFTDAEQSKLSGIEALADVTDETNVVAALSGATLTDAGVPASDDKVLIQDTSDTNNLKYIDVSDISGSGIGNVVEDTTPQLGGNLDVNGNSIVSTANGDIQLTPNGTGDVVLGTITIDADMTVGAGQDNYVLTYDNGTGLISLEAAPGASGGDAWSDAVNANIVPDADGTRNLGSGTNRFANLHVDSIDLDGTTLTGSNLTDPGADAVIGWDDSATDTVFFTWGTGLSTTTTTINAEVSLANTATLTNKTLTAPVVTTPEVSYTSDNDGTQSSGTYTPAVAGGNCKYIVNGGAFTLGVPSTDGTFAVQVTNNASAGAITTSGYTQVVGDTLTTTDGDDFMFFITKINGFSVLNVIALQ